MIADTLTQILDHNSNIARSEFNAAKTTREGLIITTRGNGELITKVSFETPFLKTRPLIATGWSLLSGFVPVPPPTSGRIPPFIVTAGIRSWVTHVDGQGNAVYDGAYVLIFVDAETGATDSSGEPVYYDYTIEHHVTFEGLSYFPVPMEPAT